MRLIIALLISLACAVVQAEDIPAFLIDEKPIESAGDKALLVTVVKAHFGEALNLQAAQRVYCSRAPQKDGTKLDTCTLAEFGTMTKRKYADAKRAGVNNIHPVQIDGDNVTYRRDLTHELVGNVAVPVQVTAGARRDSLVALIQAVHTGVELQFLHDIAIVRQPNGGADKINSRAVYLGVIDDLKIAEMELAGTFHRAAPNR